MTSIAIAASGHWLLTTTSGLQWLFSTASRISAGSLVFDGVEGTFSTMRIKSLRFTSTDLQLAMSDVELDWQPAKLLSRKLLIDVLSVQDFEVLLLPSDEPSETPDLTLPNNLHLPLAISIYQLKVAALRVSSKEDAAPDFEATGLSAKLESDGQQHQLSHFAIKSSDFGSLNASAVINGDPPFDLTGHAKLVSEAKLTETDTAKIDILATVSGSLEQVTLKIEGKGAGISGHTDAQLLPFAPFPISALRLSAKGINPKVLSSDAPKASLALDINLHEEMAGSLIGSLVVKNKIVAALDSGGLPLQEVNTRIMLSSEQLQLSDLNLYFADKGIISGNGVWQIEPASGQIDLSVSQLNPLALDGRLRSAQINGGIKLHGDTEAQHIVIALKDGTLNLTGKASHSDEWITLENLHLSRDQSQFTAQGKLSLSDQQLFSIEGNLKHFNFSDFLQAPHSDLNSTLKLTGNLAPQINGTANFKIENSKLAKHAVTGNGEVSFKQPNRLESNIDLRVGSNQLHARGALGSPEDTMQLVITAPALAQIELGLDGAIHAKAKFGGSFASPEFNFSIDGEHLVFPGNHHLENLAASGKLEGDVVVLDIEAGEYRQEKETQLQYLGLSVTGKKTDHTIQTQVKVNEDLEIILDLSGGLAKSSQVDELLKWNGHLSQFSGTGPLPFRLLAPAPLELSAEHVSFGSANFTIADGQANIDIIQWTPQNWKTQGDFTGIVLQPDSDNIPKQEALHLGGKWLIASAAHLTGHIQVAREKGDIFIPGNQPAPLGLQIFQLTANAANGNLTGELSLEGKHIGTTSANITLPMTRSDTNWTISPSASLNGEIILNINDLSWAGPALDDNIKTGGKFGLQASITGSLDKPELQGKASGENLTIVLLDQGLQLQDGKLAAKFDKSFLYIDTLNFSAPFEPPPRKRLLDKVKLMEKPGSLAISGAIAITGDESNIKIDLDHLPLAHQSHYWLILSGNSQANLSQESLNIRGKIVADAGLITQPPASHPQLADDIIVGEEPQPEVQETLLNLDATLDLGEQFYIQAAGLEGQLVGQLQLRSDPERGLSAKGSIVTRKSVFKAYGQNLQVKRGIVNFQGPLDDPGLNVLAVREGLSVEAGVEVTGTVRRPRITLVSTPNVPDLEKLSWMVLGRPSHSGGVDTSLLLTAAGSILGGQSGGGVTDQISEALGVDEISIRQGSIGDPLTSQIGTVGKRISSRAYLSYERGLTAATAGVTKLTYTLTPRINIVTRAGEDSSIDIFYTIQFD